MKQISDFEEYKTVYAHAIANPEVFWEDKAAEFHWFKKWDKTLKWNFTEPSIKWFDGGHTNLCYNCIDRHLEIRGNQTAIIWEPNDPKTPSRLITYNELHKEVCCFANVLKDVGVKKGDRVCIYMPMVPEGAIAMLACARIGAIHNVVFGGFSAKSLADRINDCGCTLLITADAVFRGDKKIELKQIADEAIENLTPNPSPQERGAFKTIVFNNRNEAVTMQAGRDFWWHELLETASSDCLAEPMEAEDPLFILYTSGSTGKPKGVLHTTGGYMVYAGYTFNEVFRPQSGDEIFWCTADIGWITGHSYLVYGPLLNGVTTVLFEGIPNWPDPGRFWEVVDKHKVNIFYTAPTAIRALEAQGTKWFEGKKLDSLRVLGSVGEPINEEAWEWYHKNVGKGNCPIVDTWWQTETGGILISPLAGITPLKPAYATLPLPGIQPVLLNEKGAEINGNNVEGNLCIKFPWPGMARTVYGDHERFKNIYYSTYPGYYFTGDGCKRDGDGYFRITGRVDDVINVSGHRIGTGEVEDALNEHPLIVESAVVGFPHDIKGQGIFAFVICNAEIEDVSVLTTEAQKLVSEKIGAFARPDRIVVVPGLPKTRSGKIMRRILRKIAEGDTSNLGDTTTLLDPLIVDIIKEKTTELIHG